MNINKILSSDVLDIIFENRNKNYGAYNLRKFYPNRVKTSLLIMFGMVILFSAFTLLPSHTEITGQLDSGGTLTTTTILQIKEVEKPVQAASQQKPREQQQWTSKFKTVKESEPATELNDITKLQVGSHTEINSSPGDIGEAIPVEVTGGGTDIVVPPAELAVDVNELVLDPDVQASFPGGNIALMRFLERNLEAPEEVNDAIQVRVKFVVGFDGNLEAFEVVESGAVSFSKEVVRVLKKMPRWNPGKKGGRNVRVYYYLPVKFQPLD